MLHKPLQAKDILAAIDSKQATLPLERLLEVEETVEAALMVVPTDGSLAVARICPKSKAEGDLILKHLNKGGFNVTSYEGILHVTLPVKIVPVPLSHRVTEFLLDNCDASDITRLLILLSAFFLFGLYVCVEVCMGMMRG